MRYRYVIAERASFSIRILCRAAGVAVSGSYAWLGRGPGRCRENDQRRAERIGAIFAASRRTYGSPRVHTKRHEEGTQLGRKRMARLMRVAGPSIAPWRRALCTTDSRHDNPMAPNLPGRQFTKLRPDVVWLADISHISTNEGWLYLTAINDMATRDIVSWSMVDHLRVKLACDALRMVLWRQPSRSLIHHSGSRVQYACKNYRVILGQYGIAQSMSRKGDCWGNAPMESFFGSLKNELIPRTTYPTRKAVRLTLFEHVEAFYNRRQRHAALAFLFPAQVYAQMAHAAWPNNQQRSTTLINRLSLSEISS